MRNVLRLLVACTAVCREVLNGLQFIAGRCASLCGQQRPDDVLISACVTRRRSRLAADRSGDSEEGVVEEARLVGEATGPRTAAAREVCIVMYIYYGPQCLKLGLLLSGEVSRLSNVAGE